jgi:hypothetical protein
MFWQHLKFSFQDYVTIVLMGTRNIFFSGIVLAFKNYTCAAVAFNFSKIKRVSNGAI